MNKEFCLYEEALEMRKLGFDEPCFAAFVPKFMLQPANDTNSALQEISESNRNICTAPLYQQAFRWFREKYNFYSNILGESLNGELNGYYYSITEEGWINYYESIDNNRLYKTYEEAELACLQKLIKIVQDETLEMAKR